MSKKNFRNDTYGKAKYFHKNNLQKFIIVLSKKIIFHKLFKHIDIQFQNIWKLITQKNMN